MGTGGWGWKGGDTPLLKAKVRVLPPAGLLCTKPLQEKIFQGFVQNPLKMAEGLQNVKKILDPKKVPFLSPF